MKTITQEVCEFCGESYDIVEDMRSEYHEVGYCTLKISTEQSEPKK